MRTFGILILLLISWQAATAQTVCSCEQPKVEVEVGITINVDTLEFLMKNLSHETGMELSLQYLQEDPENVEVMSLLGEFLFILAEIRSGNKDPYLLKHMPYTEELNENDPVGNALARVRSRVGPNFWTDKVIRKYGNLALCLTGCFRKTNPSYSGYYARYLTILLAMQEFNLMITEMKEHDGSMIRTSKGIGNFYIGFTERYIGYNALERGVEYFTEVNETYDVSKEQNYYWGQLLIRAIQVDDIRTDENKIRLIKRIRTIL